MQIGCADVCEASFKPYSTSDEWATILKLEARGVQPVDFQCPEVWRCKAESGTIFKEVEMCEVGKVFMKLFRMF